MKDPGIVRVRVRVSVRVRFVILTIDDHRDRAQERTFSSQTLARWTKVAYWIKTFVLESTEVLHQYW